MEWRLLDHEFAEADFGFNVVGFVTGALGLGVAARNTLRAMDARGIRMRVVDYHLGDDRSDHDESCLELGVRRRRLDPFPVNVFHVNPPEAAGALAWGSIDAVDRFNVCVPFWELDVLPSDWAGVLRGMDAILAPTRFVEGVVRAALPDALVLPYPQAALLPEGIEPDRGRWGLAEDAVVFVSSFDVASDTNRKNPWGAVEAFARAFPKAGRERLVLKVNAPSWARAAFPDEMERLRSAAAGDDRILLVDEILSFEDVLALYASSDVFVSLHRSEGLGLGLMESMTLGKPVIATAYSGNMDFTTPDNSCLVDYELIPVVSAHNSYDPARVGGDPTWAEPDVVQAAECMRRLSEDVGHRESLGRRAVADMAARREEYWSCRVWDELRDLVFDHESVLWERHAERIDALTA